VGGGERGRGVMKGSTGWWGALDTEDRNEEREAPKGIGGGRRQQAGTPGEGGGSGEAEPAWEPELAHPLHENTH
jgi:hypothetical protein